MSAGHDPWHSICPKACQTVEKREGKTSRRERLLLLPHPIQMMGSHRDYKCLSAIEVSLPVVGAPGEAWFQTVTLSDRPPWKWVWNMAARQLHPPTGGGHGHSACFFGSLHKQDLLPEPALPAQTLLNAVQLWMGGLGFWKGENAPE